jgi:hypothetical protein
MLTAKIKHQKTWRAGDIFFAVDTLVRRVYFYGLNYE